MPDPTKPRPVEEVVSTIYQIIEGMRPGPNRRKVIENELEAYRAEVERWAREDEQRKFVGQSAIADLWEQAEAAALLVDCPECGGTGGVPSNISTGPLKETKPCPLCRGEKQIRREWKEGLWIAAWIRDPNRDGYLEPEDETLADNLEDELRARWERRNDGRSTDH